MNRYDTIVIGGGHNGLVCATYLAKAGQRVLLLEAGDKLGGLASSREFHPGFRVNVAHTLQHFSAQVRKDLGLEQYGHTPAGSALSTVGLAADGTHVHIDDLAITGAAPEDAQEYPDYRRQLKVFAKALEPFWGKTMPGIGDNTAGELLTFAQLGLKLRMLGKDDMLEFLRVATLPMRDLMDDNFEHPLLQAALAWDGVIGSKLAPRSPNQSVLTLLYRMCGDHDGMHSVPAGGIDGLVNALRSAAEAAGVEIRTGSPVRRISIDDSEGGLCASGVELDGGESIAADRVVSSADPKRTFLDLVGARNLEIEFSNRINRLRCEGYVAKLHLALSGLPAFTGLDKPDGRMIIASCMDDIEFAFDDAKHGGCSDAPVMEVLVPSLHQPDLAPEGQHVLSAHVMYVPAKPKGGWTHAMRDDLQSRLLAKLEQFAPGIGELVLHAELLTPADLEREYRVTGGHWHHTEFAVDQMLMMRPTYEAAQYATPLPGLFLCGAGCHPGGGLSGVPGYNAAREMLK